VTREYGLWRRLNMWHWVGAMLAYPLYGGTMTSIAAGDGPPHYDHKVKHYLEHATVRARPLPLPSDTRRRDMDIYALMDAYGLWFALALFVAALAYSAWRGWRDAGKV